MFRVQYEHPRNEGIKIDITLTDCQVSAPIVNQIMELIQAVCKSYKDHEGKDVKPLEEPAKQPAPKPVDDSPVVRKRLPNRTNVIDPSKLEVDANGSRLYNNFRCPGCGQSAVVWSDGVPVVRDIVNGNKCFEVTPAFEVGKAEDFTYERACELSGDQVSIVCNEDAVCKCPRCKHTNKTQEFVDAYLEPLKYFEVEQLCPLCGDELCITIDNNNQQCWKCENEACHFFIPLQPE